MNEDRAWKQARTDWREVVLVCRKCAKKLDGGFGPDGDETLGKVLRRFLDGRDRRKVKALRRGVSVIEVGCLDVCPRKAVVVVKCSDPRSVILVPKGAEVDEVARRLRLRASDGSDPVRAETAE